MSERGDREFLEDIKEAIRRIENYTCNINFDEFVKDTMVQDAVIRNIEIIGEAVKNLSKNLKQKYNQVEWRKIAGLRDKVIHFYFGIKWDIVWSVIKTKLPLLKKEIKKIIKEIEK